MEELYNQLAALARQHGARRLVLFGSRARGQPGKLLDGLRGLANAAEI